MSVERRARRGFTLVEILVVVVIGALAAAIALPGFVRAMKGAELRTATRTVLMSHKYARSTAVLRQTQMAILLDRETMNLEVLALNDPAAADRDRFLDSRDSRAVNAVLGDEGGDQPAAALAIEIEVIRKLGNEIRISSFNSEFGGQEQDGTYWIMYYPNGMSDGFELVLSDGQGRTSEINADPVSGKIETELSRF